MPSKVGLSAPEAFVLLSLPELDIRNALKLGFMELIAQGVLRLEIEDRRGLIRTRHIPHLRVAPRPLENLPPAARSLVNIVRDAQPGGTMREVLRGCERVYRLTLSGFVIDGVGPALAARGLAEPHKRRLLGLFPVDGFRRTPAGDSEKARLQDLLREAREIPAYLDRDPAQAVALVAALGPAILLAEELRPHYQAIGQAMRQRGGGDGGAVDGATLAPGDGLHDDGGQFHHGTADFGLDLGGLDFAGIDFGAFDAGAFDSLDAGFSDGGGDGGGGDGGSSGC